MSWWRKKAKAMGSSSFWFGSNSILGKVVDAGASTPSPVQTLFQGADIALDVLSGDQSAPTQSVNQQYAKAPKKYAVNTGSAIIKV